MANVRMIPPVSGPTTIKVNGRTYTCTVGSTIDVPSFDAAIMAANGWINSGDVVGTTANRPAAAPAGVEYNDTTVGAIVISDGKGGWKHHVTGAAA